MLIGLISDTHIPDHARGLPEQLKQVFLGVDLILHAGDIYIPSVLDELEQIAPVLAAEGDDDPPFTVSDRRVKPKQVLNIDGVTIWLIHQGSWLWSFGSSVPPPHEKPPDVMVCGHTHHAMLEEKGELLRINPGSLTFPHYKVQLGTVGLLTINSGKAKAQIIQLE